MVCQINLICARQQKCKRRVKHIPYHIVSQSWGMWVLIILLKLPRMSEHIPPSHSLCLYFLREIFILCNSSGWNCQQSLQYILPGSETASLSNVLQLHGTSWDCLAKVCAPMFMYTSDINIVHLTTLSLSVVTVHPLPPRWHRPNSERDNYFQIPMYMVAKIQITQCMHISCVAHERNVIVCARSYFHSSHCIHTIRYFGVNGKE